MSGGLMSGGLISYGPVNRALQRKRLPADAVTVMRTDS